MSVPGIVESTLGEEPVATQITLSGGDEVYVTETRTIVYRAEGLLSDETVEEFDHEVDRLAIAEGRRKSTITYDDAVAGSAELTVPTTRLDDVIEPVLAGVLRATQVTDEDERIVQVFRFSELTLVITSERLLKHIGSAVWDDEYESYHFEDITDVDYEKGSVATQIVFRVDDRTQRIKIPNDEFPRFQQDFEGGLLTYRNVETIEELSTADEDDDREAPDATDAVISLEEGGIDPLSMGEDPLAGDSAVDESVTAADEDDGDGKKQSPAEAETDVETIDETENDDENGSASDEDETETAGTEDDDSETEIDTDQTIEEEPQAEDSPVATDDTSGEVIEDWESPPDESSGSFDGPFESATAGDASPLSDELSGLQAAVKRQNELLAQQHRTIRKLVESLREREASREDSE